MSGCPLPFGQTHATSPMVTTTPNPGFIVADAKNHVMGRSLKAYIESKIHQDLKEQGIRRIRISAGSRRKRPARIASSERLRKFDSRRPTTTIVDSGEVHLHCFPSRDLILHYAGLVATYLDMQGGSPGIVQVHLPDPLQEARFLPRTNLGRLGSVDIAIIGDVDYLEGIRNDTWAGVGESDLDVFRWHKFTSPSGETVALVGCLDKIWGNTGGYLVRTLLAQSGIKCAIYIAKVGSLSSKYVANEWIATGHEAYLDNELISWTNPLDSLIDSCAQVATNQAYYEDESISKADQLDALRKSCARVARGPIVTVPTLLCETRTWLEEWAPPKAVWVDCEVAYMAKEAAEAGIDFGYLHIVSDNLLHDDGENLSNEDTDIVIGKRESLYEDVSRIISAHISRPKPLHDIDVEDS
ncbi:hypothetical protein B0I35DRAFT_426139 [Stachybotrys elegans]|uniref:Nucleoside phosphorylase domain-containing protein n=1 Tax=Stachybotrys elegans TaxID=80388 RepID=A0A8K0SRD9_9HYPO|nr:hypothetical protein B0I35DRAFT_426139 [Stachybotrys elegans]